MAPWKETALGIAVALAGLYGAADSAAQDLQERVLDTSARDSVALTLYEGGFGLVSETRHATLDPDRNRLAIGGVTAQLQPETVLLEVKDARVLQQSFDFDLLTPQRLLEASLGRKVRLVTRHPETGVETGEEAEVLSVANGLVLRVGDRVETAPPGRIVFTELPGHLRSRPTLVVDLESEAGGEVPLELRYLTGGLSWKADYVAELSPSEDSLSLVALVTLGNQSGSDFEGAKIRLVAGSVNRAGPQPLHRQEMRVAMEAAAAPTADVAAVAAAERYLYTLEAPVSLRDRETRQVPLFSAEEVQVRKRYRFDVSGVQQYRNVDGPPMQAALLLELENEKDTGLGRPLPAGIVRVYQAAADGGAEIFAGEDQLSHIPEGETFELNLGRAFDVTGEARTTDFQRISRSDGTFEAAQEVLVRNAKKEAVEVEVVASLPFGWRMLSESHAHEKRAVGLARWRLQVPARGETQLRYRVRVTP